MKKMQKKARQDNKAGKDPENDEKKLNVKEEEQSKYTYSFINYFLINLYCTACIHQTFYIRHYTLLYLLHLTL